MKTQKQQTQEAVQAAIDENNVVDLPRAIPATVQLLPMERLELENLMLKSTLFQAQAKAEQDRQKQARSELASRIRIRCGVDVLARYIVDPDTGTCRLKEEN